MESLFSRDHDPFHKKKQKKQKQKQKHTSDTKPWDEIFCSAGVSYFPFFKLKFDLNLASKLR